MSSQKIIECHKPSSWIRDALFQPEPRAKYRSLLKLGYNRRISVVASGSRGTVHLLGLFQANVLNTIVVFASIISCYRPHWLIDWSHAKLTEVARAQIKPSDHAPIIVKLRVADVIFDDLAMLLVF